MQRSQLVDVVGIGEEPDVEHDVGLAREPATVGERQDGQGQPALLGALEVPGDQTPQVARRQLRGIDHQIGLFPQARHDPALVGDAVGDRTVEGERMAPARFVEATAQDLVLAVQEQELRLGRRPAAPGADPLEQIGRVEGARAAVDADGEVVIQPVARPHQAAEQRDRQIVDGLEAEILQRLERRGPASAGHPGHEDDLTHSRLHSTRCAVSASLILAQAEGVRGSSSK